MKSTKGNQSVMNGKQSSQKKTEKLAKQPVGEVTRFDKNANNNDININQIFKFIDLYFKQKNIMYAHLYNSFDKLLDEDIPTFLKENNGLFFEKVTNDKIYKYRFKYENISVKPPYIETDDEIMFPSQARTRKLTYASNIVATITQLQEVTDIVTGVTATNIIGNPEYDYPVTTMPIMIRSKYCSLNIKKGLDKSECDSDPGGYFIVNGAEKVVLSMERMIDNRPLVFTKKDSNVITYNIQVNSKSPKSDLIQIINIRMKKNNVMTIRVPILNEIPVFILMRALGIESDGDILDYVVYDHNDSDMINLVRISLENSKQEEGVKILTKDDAINFLITKMRFMKYNETDKNIRLQEKRMHLMKLLHEKLLPHVDENLIEKGFYIGFMINRLLQAVLGRIKVDDRDSFVNKRIDTAGILIGELFKKYYKKMINEASKFFKKRNPDDINPLNIINQLKPTIIGGGIKTSLLTGAWGKKKGVAQMLARLTFLQTIASLRRFNSPTIEATSKLTGPRHLHGTQAGGSCLTGDAEVLMGDGITLKQIKDIKNGDVVMTVNKLDLTTEPSRIKRKFKRMPDKLLKITISDGKILKCTEDHPILIQIRKNKYEMIEAINLTKGHLVIVKHDKNMSALPIEKIEYIELELVYDFTTVSNNHSFIANRVCLSNCFIETSEGANIGLVKNFSLIGTVTVMKNSHFDIIKSIIKPKVKNIQDVSPKTFRKYTRVLLNGEIIGLTDTPRELYNELKALKNSEPFVGVTHDIRSEIECQDIRVNCDSGRLIHPVLKVQNNELKLTHEMVDLISIEDRDSATKIISWNQFMMKFPGVVEYLDADEQYNAMIAMFPSDVKKQQMLMDDSADNISRLKDEDIKRVINRYDQFTYVKYTHCEMHPSLLLGVVVSNIPFCECNQGPRNIFQYSQARQAIGIYATNYRDRLDISYILYHPQRPIVTTRAMKYIGTERLPAGENCIVAIATYGGYNQEDSNIMNKSAIDRGLFVSTSLKKANSSIQKNQSTSQDDLFIKPDRTQVSGMKSGSYDKLNEKGYVPEETAVYNGDIIIGKITPIQPIGNSNKIFKDSSEYYKSHVSGVIDRVWTDIYDNEGYEMRKLRIRSERVPMVADKFCSRSAQKGTCGIKLPGTDMPFTANGLNVDIIINPNAMPSRMTIAQFIECVCGKVAALEGHEIDGTAFSNFDLEDIKNRLSKFGYNRDGWEYMYNGMTGQKMNNPIFIGPTYYQRLKHLVLDKIHCLTMDHEVLTEQCWKFCHELLPSDKVATLQEGELVYATASKLLYFPNFSGKLYHIKNKYLDLNVTDNHRMWVSLDNENYKLVEAKELIGQKVKYQNTAEWNTPRYNPVLKATAESEKNIQINSSAWLMIVAAWISCGDSGESTPISLFIKNSGESKLRNSFDKLIIGYFVISSKINSYNDQLYNNLMAINRNELPEWIWKLNAEQCKEFITNLILCAGDFPDETLMWFETKSNKLADDLMRLALHAGWSGHITKHKHTVRICFNKLPYVYQDNQHEELRHYIGAVFCLQVPGEVFCVRRNGHAVWTGNSRSRGPQTILTRQAPEGRARDGGLRLGEMEMNALVAHGMARFLKERFLETADLYHAHVCGKCGLFAQRMLRKDNKPYTTKQDIFWCPACKNAFDVHKVRLPYSFKLLCQEMLAMNIAPRIRVKKNAYE